MSVTRQATTQTNTAMTTTTETVVATLAGVQQNFDGGQILLEGWAQLTTGGSTTAVTIRVRRGADATGTLVGEANAEQVSAAAGSTEAHSTMVIDTPGGGGPYTYVLTLQQTGAVADGSALQATLSATTLDPHGT